MLNRLSFLIPVAAAILSAGCSSDGNSSINTSHDVLTISYDDTASPGVTIGSDVYGYSYEILNAYAEACGKELQISDKRNDNKSSGGSADMTISQFSAARHKNHISEPLYSTNYVVLASSATARALKKSGGQNLSSRLSDYNIDIVDGFQFTESYDILLDSLKNSRIYVSANSALELAKKLSGKHSLIICEKSDATIILETTKNVSQIYEFDERVHINILFARNDRDLQQDFREWYMGFQATDTFAALENSYLIGNTGKYGSQRSGNGTSISIWDSLLRKVGERENVDWRLLSAIAYHESRFNADVVSPKGALGLMQIMPVVADNFKVNRDRISDPETNITIAAKLIKNIEKTLRFGNIGESDKTSIILAAYNCGIGNVVNARKLAILNGENPDSWNTVSKYLCKMGDREYVESFNINRTFKGATGTLAYVDNVISKYRSYCNRVKK